MRADLLFGAVLVDPIEARTLVAEGFLPSQPDPVRIASLVAWLDAGLPWTAETSAATVSLLPATARIGQTPWLYDPFPEIVERLLNRAEAKTAIELVEAALRADDNPKTRIEGTWGAMRVGDTHPRLRTRLLPTLLPVLDDEGSNVMALLTRWVRGNSAVLDVLLDLASGEDPTAADRALTVMINIDAPQAPQLLAQDLPQRPRALAATSVSEGGGRLRYVRPIPCQEALLNAIRARLGAVDVGEQEASDLLGLLESWGTGARAATPELLSALPRHSTRVPGVLARVAGEPGPERDATVQALRAAAFHPEGGQAAREALRTLNEAN
ncbi:hypothetical protein WN71_020715 [Streptomyces mangrovisoli]|uniref:HEAT repeat domain-containing protein n=1 Tax=Streptomyces mangrovisoli TaxID=1428628 RepID=A0A1J4NUR5_9ACTN|nr:hypothetical protein WN71_020715 [Streptomyces mangrovisoli]